MGILRVIVFEQKEKSNEPGGEGKDREDGGDGEGREHRELGIYKLAFGAAMEIFEVSRNFPKEERYSLTDQIRRSSRSVCANLAEAWRKRRYRAAFVAKLSDCEAEAAETQTWIEFAIQCNYLDHQTGHQLLQTYNQVLSGLVKLIQNPTPWLLP